MQADQTGAIRLLVVQPTQFCNIDCAYCYVPGRDERRRASATVLGAIHERVVAQALHPEALVLWHAGEPLAVGLAAFDAMRGQVFGGARPGRLREQVQTNGTLLDDAWAVYLRDQRIHVGVSIDGPADLHDRRRRDRRGAGTHARVMRGVEALTRAGTSFSVICVVGLEALRDPDPVIVFLAATGARTVGFTVEKIEGAHLASDLDAGAHFDLVRRFFARVAAAKSAGRFPPIVREFVQADRALSRDAGSASASDESTLGRIVSISRDGEVAFFSPELATNPPTPRYDTARFGNIVTQTYAEILDAAAGGALASDVRAGLALCEAGCRFWRFCRGGSVSAKISEHGSAAASETTACILGKQASTLAYLDHLLAEAHGAPTVHLQETTAC